MVHIPLCKKVGQVAKKISVQNSFAVAAGGGFVSALVADQMSFSLLASAALRCCVRSELQNERFSYEIGMQKLRDNLHFYLYGLPKKERVHSTNTQF